MAKPEKQWRILPEFEGRVTFESECKHVVLSNTLSQEVLADLAKHPQASAYLVQAAPNTEPDVQ